MKKLTSYPLLSGALLGLLPLCAVIVIVFWFPWIGKYHEHHKSAVQAVWFTAAAFALCINRLWRWRRRSPFAFWAPICALLLLHVVGVFLYTTFVQPILVWQLSILLVLEVFFIVFLVDWTTKRFRHDGQGTGGPDDKS
jgi:hypothetical protein